MDDLVRLLFHELADVPPPERERIFAERHIAPHLRAEVESLLSFDSTPGNSFTDLISHAAEEKLLSSNPRHDLSNCGPYRLIRLLGSGGMGSVYLAERTDGEIRQKAAVKLVRAGADRPAWRDRFLKERQLLADLNHPSIVRLLDAGHTAEGIPYLAMEYVDGVPIDTYAAGLDLRRQLTLFLSVCDGVSHAHRHLIIHRDLKPSNIFVDASGQPKLLDFGIAKLLEETDDPTQTAERLLTPKYASPEQLRGGNQTTATDVYSLGAILYKILTQRSPHAADGQTSQALAVLSGTREISLPSRLNPNVPADIDCIVRKALRHEPDQRYASVEAFANDIRAFQDWRPVQARSGDAWYRTRKFLRRYWLPVAATAVTIGALLLGLHVANRERAIAQQRFGQVRRLANKVLALDEIIRGLPGSTKARHELVAMSKEYLEGLGADARADQDLALEIAGAYTILARAQGVPTTTNLGQYAQAEESLRKADALMEPLLTASPQNRKALLISAEISHSRMILAETDHRNTEALAHARQVAARLDRLLGLGQASEEEARNASSFFYNIALAHKNLHYFQDAIRYSRRSIEISRSLPFSQMSLAKGLSIIADSLRFSGDLEGALKTVREARTNIEKAAFPSEAMRRGVLFSVLYREGAILGEEGEINLDQPAEAAAVLQRAFNLLEEWAQKDPNDASSRMLFISAARELGAILGRRDPARALAVYDQALLRLGEVKNNTKARRGEAQLLAGSSYPLRLLKRTKEARDRIDIAFRLLRETKDYPVDRIDPNGEAEAVVSALADHHAETGQLMRAAEIYQELLAKIMASQPNPQNDLRHATRLSHIYQMLAGLHRRNGQPNQAEALAAARLSLWSRWDAKLPRNSFVRRQLEAARI